MFKQLFWVSVTYCFAKSYLIQGKSKKRILYLFTKYYFIKQFLMDILNLLGLKLKLIYGSNNYEPLKCFSMLYKRYKNVTMKNLSKTLLWPPDAKSQLIGKDSDTGKD